MSHRLAIVSLVAKLIRTVQPVHKNFSLIRSNLLSLVPHFIQRLVQKAMQWLEPTCHPSLLVAIGNHGPRFLPRKQQTIYMVAQVLGKYFHVLAKESFLGRHMTKPLDGG